MPTRQSEVINKKVPNLRICQIEVINIVPRTAVINKKVQNLRICQIEVINIAPRTAGTTTSTSGAWGGAILPTFLKVGFAH